MLLLAVVAGLSAGSLLHWLHLGVLFADYAPGWNLLPRVGGITESLAPHFFFAIGSRLNTKLFSGTC